MENYKLIKLRDLRIQRNLTQEELGRELGFTKSAISNYENGNRIPDINVLVLYSRFFGVSIDFIVGNAEFPQTQENACQKHDDFNKNQLLADFEKLDIREQGQVYGFIKGLIQAKANSDL